MTTSHLFKLSKSVYCEEAINEGIAAFNQYLSDSKIVDESLNFVLTLQVKPDAQKVEAVTGKLLNFILEASIESAFQDFK